MGSGMKYICAICVCAVHLLAVAGCGFGSFEAKTDAPAAVPSVTEAKPDPVTLAMRGVRSDDVKFVVPEGISVLMYHKVGPEADNDAVIREDLFKAQLKYLADNGYHPLTLDELYTYVTEGKAVPEKPVVLTFDDGYADTYTIVYPLLRQYGFPATVFVNPGDIGTRLTWEQLREMHDGGVTISNHTFDHVEMNTLSPAEQERNIVRAQEALKRELGIDNSWLCYPYGEHDADTMAIAERVGIKMAFDMAQGRTAQGQNPYELRRVWVGNSVDIENFKERVNGDGFLR